MTKIAGNKKLQFKNQKQKELQNQLLPINGSIQFSKTGLFPKYSDDKNIAGWPSKDCNSIRRNKMNHKTYYYLLNGPTFTPIRFSPNRNLKLNQCANKLFKIKIHKFSDDEDC